MNILSDTLTVTGAAAGIVLLLTVALAPLLAELPAPRRRDLPGDAVGILPATGTPADEPEIEVPVQGAGGRATLVREAQLVLPMQRTAVAVAVPGQRSATRFS
ncbi:hypothetical protein [Pseudonocardia xishanensis]|uniref:Uncharacterized protein n=1 Tax=Pseudonocardia xishanensis TaxID=630995 RepID=A0ABP8S524_9PSEU